MKALHYYFLRLMVLFTLLLESQYFHAQGTYPLFKDGFTFGINQRSNFIGVLDRVFFFAFESHHKVLKATDGTDYNNIIRISAPDQTEIELIHQEETEWFFSEKRGDIFYISKLTSGSDSLTRLYSSNLEFGNLLYWNGQFAWIQDSAVHSRLQLYNPFAHSLTTLLELDSADIRAIGNSDSLLYFIANDDQHQKWMGTSEGTQTSTHFVKQLFNTGIDLDQDTKFFSNHEEVYFFYNPQNDPLFLWKTDGTEAGTIQIGEYKPPYNGWSDYPTAFLNDKFFFTLKNLDGAWNLLHVSNGTVEGTYMLDTISVLFSKFETLTSLNNKIYYSGNAYDLRCTDGTTNGTKIIFDGLEHNSKGIGEIYDIGKYNGQLVLSAHTDSLGAELYTSDGTINGTTLLSDVLGYPTLPSYPGRFIQKGNLLYFTIILENLYHFWIYDPEFKHSCDSFQIELRKLVHASDQNLGLIEVKVSGGQPLYFTSLNGSPFNWTYEYDKLDPGVYTISAIDNFRCLDSITVEVENLTGISITQFQNVVNISPNPIFRNSGINILFSPGSLTSNGNITLTLLSLTGQLCLNKVIEDHASISPYHLSTEDILPGQYVLSVMVDGKIVASKKLVIL